MFLLALVTSFLALAVSSQAAEAVPETVPLGVEHGAPAEESSVDSMSPQGAVGEDSVGLPLAEESQESESKNSDDGGNEDEYSDVESITVTGQAGKVWEDVAESSIGFTAMEIDQERITDIADLAQVAPNLQIQTAFAATNPVLFIRGVGLDDFNANSASAVAIYQDGVYMNSPAGQLFQFFDVANVEVLRGPQAGRYRNASAGAILVQSQAPTPEFETSATFTYGNYNLLEAEAVVNVPVIEDTLMARFAGKFTVRDGYTENRCGDRPRLNFDPGGASESARRRCVFPHTRNLPDDFVVLGEGLPVFDPVNDARNWAVRGQLLYNVPLDVGSMEWLLNIHGGQNDSLATQYQQRAFRANQDDQYFSTDASGAPASDASAYYDLDGDPFAGDYNNGGYEKLDLVGGNLHGLWSVSDSLEVVSITGFEWHTRNTLENTDANPKNLLTTQYFDKAWQFSEELRVDSYWSDTLESSVGAYFLTETLNVSNQFQDSSSGSFPKILLQSYEQNLNTFAVFGEFNWTFTDRWKLEGDIRYSHEFKEMDNFSTAYGLVVVPGVGIEIGTLPIGFNVSQAERTFIGTSGMASLTYDISDEDSIYLKYTRGWKPGHFNGGAVYSRTLIEPVKPENLNSVEIGTHLDFMDGLLGIQAAAFYYDYEDMQIFALEQDDLGFPLPQLINASGAEIFGVEFGLRAEPVEGLSIRYDVAFLETEYVDFSNTISKVITNGGTSITKFFELDYTGNRLIGSPAWSMSGSIQYVMPFSLVGVGGELIPRFSFSWEDDSYFDPGEGRGPRLNLPVGTTEQKAYGLMNASLMWRSPEQVWEVTGWVRNIGDNAYKGQSFDLTDSFRFVLDVYGAPRTFGLTVSGFY